MNNKKSTVLEIKNLHANIGNTSILKGINLTINFGEIHAIMGKNGSGKSTLAKVIAGHPSYSGVAQKIKDALIYLKRTQF